MAMAKAKRPAEVFGTASIDLSTAAKAQRQKYLCPYIGSKCIKQTRLATYPMGVCSVDYNGDFIAICPKRFLQDQRVFKDIADQHFGTRNDLIVFSEIGLKTIGTFDYVMVKHKPMSDEIEDFVVIEFQTGQTTGTGKLVQGLKDVMKGTDIAAKSYAFGLNTYDVWKRSFTQILNKGIVLEAWQRKIYWVVQEQVVRYLFNRYHLNDLSTDPDNATVFLMYDLVCANNALALVNRGLCSASVDHLFNAFRLNPSIPKRKEFEVILNKKLRARLGFELH
ncbi:MAG: NotI family restriction endonuclease [Dehalococcoidia bacterium]|nr:NotI family restriction endonuclease [Dehalococcoidia bacterium]MDD5494170.1 NotI family restriction endonuclease [Dehalococcoidia bacterium]